MKNIDVAIINAGGRGTRFYPLTLAVPKEMLPIRGIPAIEYVIDECRNAGIDKIIISANAENIWIIRKYLQKRDKYYNLICEKLEMLDGNEKQILISDYSFSQAYGNAVPILSFRSFLQGKKFAVLFADDIILEKNGLQELVNAYKNSDVASVIAAKHIPKEMMSAYGNIKVKECEKEGVYRVERYIQKPQKESEIVSDMAVVSRLILDDTIFKYIDLASETEMDLGAALDKQAAHAKIIAKIISGTWVCVDAPDKYLKAQIVAEKN